MNLDISLKELAELQKQILSKQPSFTLEKAKQQVERLKNQNSSIKKTR